MRNRFLPKLLSSRLRPAKLSTTTLTAGSANKNSNILNALYSTAAPQTHDHTQYCSPYRMLQKPLDAVVLYNRSPYAMKTAEDELKDPWEDLITIHVVEKGTRAVKGASLVLEVDKWGDFNDFAEKFEKLAAENPRLRAAKQAGKIGFYDIWAPLGESSAWARQVIAGGFKRIGASPDAMDKLDKINLKRLCETLGIPTAPFAEIAVPAAANGNLEQCIKTMAEQTIAVYQAKDKSQGNAVFLKHVNGGGGRGSKKVLAVDMTQDHVEKVLRQIIKDTGNNPEGVYKEGALDFIGKQMMQIELECDGEDHIEEEARVVFFNKLYQKVLEIGCTAEAMKWFFSEKLFQDCRAAAKKLIKHAGYDNRGTIEILVSISPNGAEEFYISEVNMRRQVEAPAIEELVADAVGRRRNTTAEQVMRSCGFPAPGPGVFRKAGPEIVGHIRLLSGELSEEGMKTTKGVTIHGAFVPPNVTARYVTGRLNVANDAQIGCALIKAQNWKEFCANLLSFSQEFQFYGPKTELSNYFSLFAKLAQNPKFIARKLGCNETMEVLADPPVPKGKSQKIMEALVYTMTPLITHGYRRKQGLKDRPYPTRAEINDYKQFMDSLTSKTAAETPFSRWLQHQNYELFIAELRDQLEKHGGGTVSVVRDLIQSLMDQEAALVQRALTKINEVYGARSGIIVGNEEGGAQYQAGEMRTFLWLSILLAGCPSNLRAYSLMRTIFMNGLSIKSIAKQKFVIQTLRKVLQDHYGWRSASTILPWSANNFHAGNHSQGDITTGLLLEANIPVIPNFAWEPRYSDDAFKGWVRRQIALFQKAGKPLLEIRIKNPGQGKLWTSEGIVSMVGMILKTFEQQGLPIPIIYLHNHNFDNNAANIAARAIQLCQEMGYRQLVVDSIPDGFLSHNSNLVIADALDMSAEEREYLAAYNDGVHKTLKLLSRFDNTDITKKIQDPDSEWAGGTNSSDIADAIKQKIPLADIPKALALSKEVFGLGTPVTPYSEALKQAGFAIWINADIQPKTAEAVRAYLVKGGKLAISNEILGWFAAWRTLLPRPEATEQLLGNHGIPLDYNEDFVTLNESLDIEGDRKWLQAQLPNTLVTDQVLATYYMFDKIGLEALKHRDHSPQSAGPRNMTLLMDNPELPYSEMIQIGDSFTIEGEKVTIRKIQANPETGMIDIDYEFQGKIVQVNGIDPNTEQTVQKKAARFKNDLSKESIAPMTSKITLFKVKQGDVVQPGQVVAEVEAMKMTHQVKAPAGDKAMVVEEVLEAAGEEVDADQVLVTFKRP